jgi:hypothetical protein
VGDVELTQAQRAALEQKNPAHNRQLSGVATMVARRREERRRYQAEGRALAASGDPRHAAGCMLYWGEGDKNRNCVGLSNSDPEIIAFFLAFLRRFFVVPDEKVRIRCNLFADHFDRQAEIERFWLERLRLPRECLAKSIVNAYSSNSARKRINRLPYGTCKLTVCNTRIVQSLYGAIQEYAGFEREEWLG